jgi:hypothetical protein
MGLPKEVQVTLAVPLGPVLLIGGGEVGGCAAFVMDDEEGVYRDDQQQQQTGGDLADHVKIIFIFFSIE